MASATSFRPDFSRLFRATRIMAFGILTAAGCSVPTQTVTARDGDVDVLARGPVHEAYAKPVSASPEPGPVIATKPPDSIEELPPDQKPNGDNVQWIPGYWSWGAEAKEYIWVSGFWRDVPPG